MVEVTDYLDTITKIVSKAKNLKGNIISKPGDWMKLKYDDIQSINLNLVKMSDLYNTEKNALVQENTNLKIQIQQLQES